MSRKNWICFAIVFIVLLILVFWLCRPKNCNDEQDCKPKPKHKNRDCNDKEEEEDEEECPHEKKEPTCCPPTPSQKIFQDKPYLTVIGSSFVQSTIANAPIDIITWAKIKSNESPVDAWLPSASLIDPTKISGWIIPKTGAYSIAYHTLAVTDAAAGIILVNGNPLFRSLSLTLDILLPGNQDEIDTLISAHQLSKYFLVNLIEGDVISLGLIALTGNFMIPTDGLGVLHSMTLQLVDDGGNNRDSNVDLGTGVVVVTTLGPTSTTPLLQQVAVAHTKQDKIQVIHDFLQTLANSSSARF